MRSSFGSVAISAVAVLALAGCGAGTTATAPTGSASATTPSAVASSAPTTASDSSSSIEVTPAGPPSQVPAAPPDVAMPNPQLTPGETFSGVTVSQVCTSGYARSVRHVTSQQYHEVYAAYGVPYPEPSGTYELDHLIPLELGGDNADANLWPEPASPTPGFHQKDDLENTMHDLVCSGRLDLGEAQREIASDWYAAYRRYVGR